MTQHITPRDFHFDFSSMPTAWLNNNFYSTHMFNGPSLGVPYMEGLVNFIVKKSLDKITDKHLLDNCLNFIQQETFHSREHVKYNQQLRRLGYHADTVVNKIKSKLNHAKKKWSLLSVLALALAFECLVNTISITVLENHILQDADPTIKNFWQWHMMEELEHKSVVFDLYQHLGGGYLRRVGIYTLVTSYYCYYAFKIYLDFVRKDQGSTIKGWLFVTSKKSFFMKSLFKSLVIYQFRYHPEQTPTNHLVNAKAGFKPDYTSRSGAQHGQAQ